MFLSEVTSVSNSFMPGFETQLAEAIIDKVVSQGEKWRVKYQATTWFARCVREGMSLSPNDVVYVVGRKNLTLLIDTENTNENN
ncbi:MAG: NfeD family protein [Elainellaceae cyanobacterium]